jgi:hypothetical protein
MSDIDFAEKTVLFCQHNNDSTQILTTLKANKDLILSSASLL